MRYFSIMVSGTVLALTTSLFIVQYIGNELSYNTHTDQSKNIYQIVSSSERNDFSSSETNGKLAKLIKEKSPYVEDATRYESSNYEFEIDSNIFTEVAIHADTSFFSLFDFPFVIGDSKQFAGAPNGVVVSERFAAKYYQSENPIGKTLLYSQPMQRKEELMITGVMKNLPQNSTINGDVVINMSIKDNKARYKQWHYRSENYILISDNKLVPEIEKNIPVWLSAELRADDMEGFAKDLAFELQCFDSVYLHSENIKDATLKGNYKLVKYIYSNEC